MNTLLQRTLFGALFVGIMIGSLFMGFPYFAGVVLLLTGLSLLELNNIFRKLQYRPNLTLILTAGLSLVAIAALHIQGLVSPVYALIPAFLMFLTLVLELFSKHNKPLENMAVSLFSWFYILIPFVLMLHISMAGEYEPLRILSIFILMWSFDSFAYLTGSWLGKHKMAERISPKKSWEGFAGGLISTVLISLLISHFWDNGESTRWIIIALITGIFGTFGDLLESRLKRQAGIKDSGNIIPGHGGILDRFDAILLVVPVVYLYLNVIEPLIF